VLADDKLQDLRMTRRTRTFADKSDSDAMRSIASDHSLTSDIDVSGPTHKVLAQVNQSDLAFLASARMPWVPRSGSRAPSSASRNAARAATARSPHVAEPAARIHVTADLASQRTAVSVSGWDVSGKQAIKADATDSAVSSELGNDTSGFSILKNIAPRKENLAHPVPVPRMSAVGRRRVLPN
jgi:phage protein D